MAEHAQHLPKLEARLAETRGLGYDHEEMIDRTELLRLVPRISPHSVGALIAGRDDAADPHRTLRAYRHAAEAAGITILEGLGVTAIERLGADWLVRADDDEFVAPTIINAAGAWSATIAAMVGDQIPRGTKHP